MGCDRGILYSHGSSHRRAGSRIIIIARAFARVPFRPIVQDFFEWSRSKARPGSRWLVLGKGPSFSRRTEHDLGQYLTVGLNHVLREQPVLLTHAIDIEVVEHCQDCLAANTQFIVMPWVPHERKRLPVVGRQAHFAPSEFDLAEWCERIPALGQMTRDGRLFWYNLHTAGERRRRTGSPVVTAHGFSATAAVRLLAMSGARTIRTLGIDGGNRYASEFKDLSATTRLQSWQSDFDMQFEDFARSIVDHGLDLAPLDVQSPARIYVGTEPEQRLAFEVLRYSIRRHASLSVDVRPLFEACHEAGISIPVPNDACNRPRTPFTFQRFAIPRLTGRQGRAIYLDSDMLVFRDIRTLWTWPLEGADLLSVREPPDSAWRPQFSVMVLDCAALRWEPADIIRQLDAGQLTYEEAVFEMKAARRIAATLPDGWNDLERYRDETALLHYTDMSRQPWLTTDNPNARHWCQALIEAIDAGQIARELVVEEVRRGHVRPSLLYQLEHRVVDPLLLPGAIRRADRRSFIPPHTLPERWREMRRDNEAGWVERTLMRAYARLRQASASKPVRRTMDVLRKILRNLR